MNDRTDIDLPHLAETLTRIAAALERLAPRAPAAPDLAVADAFVWHPVGRELAPVARVNRVDMSLLKGVDRVRDILVENTARFARGLPANNALLWGARGMGKSSLVKAAHASFNHAHGHEAQGGALKLVEIHREDIESLARADGDRAGGALSLHRVLRRPVVRQRRHLLQVPQGGAGRRHRGAPRERDLLRHLEPTAPPVARHDGERTLDRDQPRRDGRRDGFAVRPVRPGLGFHRCSQDEYLAMVEGYVGHYGVPIAADDLRREALEWATTRGSRSGRVAWQYVQDLAGRRGVPLAEPGRREANNAHFAQTCTFLLSCIGSEWWVVFAVMAKR